MANLSDIANIEELDYKVVKKQKRTLFIGPKSYFIQFPKTVFVKFKGYCFCYALNGKNELCYMPFYNIDNSGQICFIYNSSEYLNNTIDDDINKFYNDGFKVCYDNYSNSIRNYIVLGDYDIFYKNFQKYKLVKIEDEYEVHIFKIFKSLIKQKKNYEKTQAKKLAKKLAKLNKVK